MDPKFLNEPNNAVARLQRALESVHERHRQMRRERKQLWDKVEEFQRLRQSADAAMSAKLADAAKDKKLVTELQETLRSVRQQLAEANTKNGTLQNEIASRNNTIKDRENTIEQLRPQRDRAQSLQKRVEELEAELQQAQAKAQSADSEVGTLKELLAGLEAESKALSEERDAIGTLRTENEDLQEKVREQTRLLETMQEELDRARTGGDQQGRIEELKRMLNETQQTLQQREADYRRANQELEQMKTQPTNGFTDSAEALSQQDRQWMIEQITEAIERIDEHIGQ